MTLLNSVPLPTSPHSQGCPISILRAHVYVREHGQGALQEKGLPGGSVLKNPPVTPGDVGPIPGLGRAHGEGNVNPLQYSCLGNPTDRAIC